MNRKKGFKAKVLNPFFLCITCGVFLKFYFRSKISEVSLHERGPKTCNH